MALFCRAILPMKEVSLYGHIDEHPKGLHGAFCIHRALWLLSASLA